MLTASTLAGLAKTLAGSRVLSVYIDGRSTDPARKTAWRRDLEHGLDALRHRHGGVGNHERAELELAITQLEHALDGIRGAMGAPGWVGFFTASGALYAEAQPCPVPALVDWRVGPRLAPAIGLLSQGDAGYVALVDARAARVFRVQAGTLERVTVLHAHAQGGPVLHMGDAPHESFHQGTHGRTGADEADRVHRAGRERLYHALAERLESLAAPDAPVLFAGPGEDVHEAIAQLSPALARRVRTEPALDIHASESEIVAAGEAAAAAAREAGAAEQVVAVVDLAGAGTTGALGWRLTHAALEQRQVRTLFVTRAFLDRRVNASESLVRRAFAQHAGLVLVSGPAAERLDAAGDGVAALLRYPAVASPSRAARAEPELAT